ncbi:MAG TPA: hypothetical protein VD886_17790 [Herpetosiphonaceae bacterium]|nr:hypothetical protein [Herpetosiphonaceae bacterium]
MITHDELISWLRERSIVRLEWSVFFNNDESDFGPGMRRLADGSSQPFDYSLGDKSIDKKLWSISSYNWTSNIYGLYVLDVMERVVKRTASVYTEWELAENEAYYEAFPDAAPMPKPVGRLYDDAASALLVAPLDPDQQDTIALDDLPNA